MRPSSAGLLQLRKFVRETVTPKLISEIQKRRGYIAFDPTILRRTKNQTLAYHGFDCCLHAAQIVKSLLEQEEQFGKFDIVSPNQNSHHFLRHKSEDENPLIIDPSIRQHTSHPTMDLIGQYTLEGLRRQYQQHGLSSEEKELAQAIRQYMVRAREYSVEDIQRIENAMLNIAQETPAIFVGHKSEIESHIKRTFEEVLEPALKFDKILTQKMIAEALDDYRGKPKSWPETSPEFIKEVEEFFRHTLSTSPQRPEASVVADSSQRDGSRNSRKP